MDERVERIIHHPVTIPVVTGLLSFGCGMTLGYVLGKKREKTGELYELPSPDMDLTEEDLAEIQEPVVIEESTVSRDEDLEQKGADFVQQIIEQNHYASPEEGPSPREQNVFKEFASEGPDWNWEHENEIRKADGPYVLHEDEFHAREKGYNQSTLTYYAGDDVMVDPEDQPITRYPMVIGELMFGHGSSDGSVFFVRNDKLRGEYEIIRHPGKYAIEVLNIHHSDDDEAEDIRHSSRPGKFRDD